ncbi:DUF1194 domain-containing protein [Pelagibius sp. Alg239-R121]|uniref:DUF1194 domain-containing protein n=1 Tax=Pelagibius sp. Alg239-R121 TaxID=2993448 RepID=UPI0024A6E630|nr:DUF1194 domain-containing protein [Pelagibius sp. Alg239-R121]
MRTLSLRSLLCLGILSCLPSWPPAASEAAAAENVALELVLAIDVSSSVNKSEYALQMSGFAEAFRHPAVVTVIESLGSQGIVVTLVQWSGADTYVQAIDWTRINGKASAEAFAAQVETAPRLIEGGATAIGDAMLFARALLELNDFVGTRRTVDVSGDGVANQGKQPAVARAVLNAEDITVNGLAILNEEPRLGAYYRAGVVGGPNAFLITATDFEDFARAIRIKLVTEIDGPLISENADEIELASGDELTGEEPAGISREPLSAARHLSPESSNHETIK